MALRILCCVKRVPAPGARIVLTADKTQINTNNLGFAISPHEECGVEAAVQLVEKHGGSTTVLTLGAGESDEQLRYSLSVGADKAILIPTDGSEWDPQATARSLTAAIQELEAADGPFDLVIWGNESADSGGFQVGIRVARALGRPIVQGIKGLELSDDGSTMTARRESASGYEVYELPLPAMVGVKEGITLPRYPTLPARLKSKKAEVPSLSASRDAGGLTTGTFDNPVEVVTETVVLGTGAAAAPAVVDLLDELGLL